MSTGSSNERPHQRSASHEIRNPGVGHSHRRGQCRAVLRRARSATPPAEPLSPEARSEEEASEEVTWMNYFGEAWISAITLWWAIAPGPMRLGPRRGPYHEVPRW